MVSCVCWLKKAVDLTKGGRTPDAEAPRRAWQRNIFENENIVFYECTHTGGAAPLQLCALFGVLPRHRAPLTLN